MPADGSAPGKTKEALLQSMWLPQLAVRRAVREARDRRETPAKERVVHVRHMTNGLWAPWRLSSMVISHYEELLYMWRFQGDTARAGRVHLSSCLELFARGFITKARHERNLWPSVSNLPLSGGPRSIPWTCRRAKQDFVKPT